MMKKVKWVGLALAGLGAMALSSSATANYDLMKVCPQGHLITGKVNEDLWWAIPGRFQFDFVGFNKPTVLALYRKFGNGLNMRRTYLGVMGGLGCDFGFRIGLEFESGKFPIRTDGLDPVVDGTTLIDYTAPDNVVQATGWRSQSKGITTKFLPTFIEYRGICDGVRVAVGNIAIPIGLEYWGGNNTQLFMEESLMTRAFVPSFSTGIYADGRFGCFNVAVAVFSNPGNYKCNPADRTIVPDPILAQATDAAFFFANFEDQIVTGDHAAARVNERFGIAARVTTAPFSSGCCNYHFGVSGMYKSFIHTDRHNNAISTAEHITLHPGLTAGCTDWLISTSPLPTHISHFRARRMMQIGLEAAAVFGPLQFRAEWITREYRRDIEWGVVFDNVTYNGWYVDASYVITGEHRRYDECSGTFMNPVPCRPCCGAVEAVLRVEQVDLDRNDPGATVIGTATAVNDNALAVGGLYAGREENVSAGINWFVNDYVTVRANYVIAKLKEARVAPTGFKLDGFGVRAQINF